MKMEMEINDALRIQPKVTVDSYFTNDKFVKELTPRSFTNKGELKSKGCYFIMFYSPQCGFCEKLKSKWRQLAEIAQFYNVAAFNCSLYKDEPINKSIDGFPTLMIFSKGRKKDTYDGERKVKPMLEYLMNKCD